jgi:hypothetical protein
MAAAVYIAYGSAVSTMELSGEQRKVLKYFRDLVVDAGMDKILAALRTGEDSLDPSLISEPSQTIARLFCFGEAVESARVESHASQDLVTILEAFGLLRRNGDLIGAGGPDGLAIVRRLLTGLPEVLAPNGRCLVVGALPGDSEGPEPTCFQRLAAEANLGITISCLYSEELDVAMLASCAGTAVVGDGREDATEVFRDHFARLGATRLYYFLLTAALAARPSVYLAYDNVQRASVAKPSITKSMAQS